MAADAASLCSERHYMGSSASGRYATDRSERRRPWHPRYPEDLAQAAAARPARTARYLRDADVVWWVADHAQASADIAACDRVLGLLAKRMEQTDDTAVLEEARSYVARFERGRAELLDRRREASRQLRLIGISPQEQAQILQELQRRSREA